MLTLLVVEKFNLYPSEYIPAPFERLGGYSAKSKLATSNVHLLFLINIEMEHPPAVKKQYQAPQHVVREASEVQRTGVFDVPDRTSDGVLHQNTGSVLQTG